MLTRRLTQLFGILVTGVGLTMTSTPSYPRREAISNAAAGDSG